MLAKSLLIALALATLPISGARADTRPPLVVLGNLGNSEAYRRTEGALNERLQQFVDWMADRGVPYRRVQVNPGENLRQLADAQRWPANTVAMLWVYLPGEEVARFRLPAYIDIGQPRSLNALRIQTRRFHPVRAIVPRARADDPRRANISMYESIIIYALLLRAAENEDERRTVSLISNYLNRVVIPRAQSESLTMSLVCLDQIRSGIREVGQLPPAHLRRDQPPGTRNLSC